MCTADSNGGPGGGARGGFSPPPPLPVPCLWGLRPLAPGYRPSGPRPQAPDGLSDGWRTLPSCSRTRPSSLPMASGSPAAMVELLDVTPSDFPGAPGRQGPGRSVVSGPRRPGAPPPDQGAPP
ncbi:hypothetical protein STRAU_1066 [Streptomyces aurantiacus JA 4570]|uniref:Uncharacterized protein n=1 Tax=Streptomyces aurantiacus JA 4570 TaxID=1286094 RepID=S4A543_9ACTN|nr:hypothetical protein STRAU_1066 [Streptomyces aurantiacus JA 4570]